MNNLIRCIILFSLILTCSNLYAQKDGKLTRKEKRELKLQKKKEKFIEESYFREQQELNKYGPVTDEDVVYIFGVGTNFNDSTVYLTRITPLDSIRIDKKTGFLPNRVEFSIQLKQYLEGTLGLVNETTSIFFSEKSSKIYKYYYKLKKRYIDEGYKDLIVIDPNQFTFNKPSFISVK